MGQNSSTFHSACSSDYPSPGLPTQPSDPSPRSSGKEAASDALEMHSSTPSDEYNHPSTLHPNQPSPSHQLIYAEQSSTYTSHATLPSINPRQSESSLNGKYPMKPQGEPLAVPSAYSQSQGMFSGSRNMSFRDNTFIEYNATSDDFMEKFLLHTIIGAEYDSSDRYPPPRCHPGTRLAIVERCKTFIVTCNGNEKMRWVFGPAGVGKSAIMQMVAEETPADASVFLSVNGRQDGTKTFTTIAYQLTAKYEPYRQFIRNEITRDPSLLRKLLRAQFQKFIVEPFIHRHIFNFSDRYLIIIDGLDECDNPGTQQDLLELISDFCLSYPTSPIVWFIASRPEPHISSFFDDDRVAPVYTKEEIMVDSDEACQDVQKYLRDELNRIKRAYPTLKRKREWPSELEFTKIATAAGGLFAYASTVVRYIGDAHYGDPVSQLDDILIAVNAGPKVDMLNNPLALLDTLYGRIMSKIPDGVMINTRKLLLIQSNYARWPRDNFRKQCNRLGLREDAAYGALCHLHAVMKVPPPDKADNEPLTCFHKSFEDFLFHFTRSGFSRNIREEASLLKAQCWLRIVEQVPDSLDFMTRGEIKCGEYGFLKGSPSVCDNISLSWPSDERSQATDHALRLNLYRETMANLCRTFKWHKPLRIMTYFHALTTRFAAIGYEFPVYSVRDSAFDDFRHELMDLDKLKKVPLRALDYAAICGSIQVRFTTPVVAAGVRYSNPWNPICKHSKDCVDDSPQQQEWTTEFIRSLGDRGDSAVHADIPRFNIKAGQDSHWECVGVEGQNGCSYCSQRLARHLLENPELHATVFVDSSEMCYVELAFVDVEDGVSEWRYRFFHSGSPLFDK